MYSSRVNRCTLVSDGIIYSCSDLPGKMSIWTGRYYAFLPTRYDFVEDDLKIFINRGIINTN